MKKFKVKLTSFKVLFPLGAFCHLLVYILDEDVIRDESVTWFLIAIPTIIGSVYLIRKWEVLQDQTYRQITGIKLMLVKAVFCLAIFVVSFAMFGAYLDLTVLGTNLLVTGETKFESFNIVEVESVKPLLRRRTKKRIPSITFSNGKITDKVELHGVDFTDFDQNVSKIDIEFKEGLWGYGVIESVGFLK